MALVQRTHVRGVHRVLGLGPGSDAREGLDVDERRHQGHLPARHELDRLVGETGAMLDAVDSGGDELGGSLLAETVCRHLGTEFMGSGDGGTCDVGWPQWRKITDRPVDPVTDELHPTVPGHGLSFHLGDEIIRIDLGCIVADVALGSGDVTSRSNHPRQVVAGVDPVCVAGRPGVADEQGTHP